MTPTSLARPRLVARVRGSHRGSPRSRCIAVVWMTLTVGNPLSANTLNMATGPEGRGNAALGLR